MNRTNWAMDVNFRRPRGEWRNAACEKCNREVVSELPKESYPIQCAGCNKPIYGLEYDNCRQVILNNTTDRGLS